MEVIDKAFKAVRDNEPNAKLIAELGCSLEQSIARSRRLDQENRHMRASYKQLKQWTNRLIKYYKAHRDELLNDRRK